MAKELCLDPSVPNHIDSYIVVGDTIGDKTITEIWGASTGKIMFTISGGSIDWYATFEELINLMKIEEANKSERCLKVQKLIQKNNIGR